jgi:hypothetical protein
MVLDVTGWPDRKPPATPLISRLGERPGRHSARPRRNPRLGENAVMTIRANYCGGATRILFHGTIEAWLCD